MSPPKVGEELMEATERGRKKKGNWVERDRFQREIKTTGNRKSEVFFRPVSIFNC